MWSGGFTVTTLIPQHLKKKKVYLLKNDTSYAVINSRSLSTLSLHVNKTERAACHQCYIGKLLPLTVTNCWRWRLLPKTRRKQLFRENFTVLTIRHAFYLIMWSVCHLIDGKGKIPRWKTEDRVALLFLVWCLPGSHCQLVALCHPAGKDKRCVYIYINYSPNSEHQRRTHKSPVL